MRQLEQRMIFVLAVVLVSPVLCASVPAEQAASRAVNNLRVGESTISLNHPRHDTTWTRSGVRFEARRGPSWEWSLGSVRIGNASVDLLRDVAPSADRHRLRVDYDRGALIERYVCRSKSVEQQFVIPRRLSSEGADLVIVGNIRSSGTFTAVDAGWVWDDGRGVVSLGQVMVYDSEGLTVPARMRVTANRVAIIVDGTALANAAYPVIVDPEIGTNDFRISVIGTDGNAASDAFDTAVAYNSTNNEFLVVWSQSHSNDMEIYGQRINALTHVLIGSNFRISDMGPDANPAYAAVGPSVAYNSTNNEYLVLWAGDDNTPPLVDNENEIFGQRLNAATGAEIGTNDFRISNMGVDGMTSPSAFYPRAAYNSASNEYLVVWYGFDGADTEIWGQRLNASNGGEVGAQLTLSDVGVGGESTRSPTDPPGVAYNATNNEYLVVWAADDLATDNELEVFGQRVTAAGAETGTNDFRISSMGPDGNTSYFGHTPAVTWNSVANEYLVVWNGTDNTAPLVLNEYEIFGQRLSGATGTAVGTDDFRISNAGTNGDAARDAQNPHVSYSAAINEYFVVWHADAGATDDEKEIWGQRVSSSGAELGVDDKLSDMGPDGNVNYTPSSQQVAHSSAGTALIVWTADDNTGSLVDEEFEVYGQFFGGFPSGATTTITANPTAIPADGSSTSTITVQAKDDSSSNINSGGASVSLMTTLGSLGSVTDNGNGTYTATLTSTVSTGTATVSGTINGAPITDTATVGFEFGPPTNLSATAINTSQVQLTWTAVSGATSYDIYRASVIPSYGFLVSTVSPSHTDNGLTANQTYVYIVRASSATETSAFSTPDVATTIIFTDPTLNSSIMVKAAHVTQLRTAVTAMRAAADLTGYGFTDFTVTAGTTIVKAVHISELRAALDPARTAIGLSPIVYTDTTLTPSSTMVKAVHLTQLRQGTQ